jgi:nucleotide-binding universal stress UspA family protein
VYFQILVKCLDFYSLLWPARFRNVFNAIGTLRALCSSMLPFKKILFPVDYSSACDAVIPYVKEMMHRFSADLSLVHAYGAEALAYSQLPLTDPEVASEAHDGEACRLKEFAATMFPGHHVECAVRLGEAGKVIDNLVQHQGADLVMMPTHGHGPVRRLLLGSVTSKVLHDVSAAVWTATGYALTGYQPHVAYRTILCPVDQSKEADAVFTAASALARYYEARLRVIRVVEIPPEAMRLYYEVFQTQLMEAADFRLREMMARLNLDAPHAVLEGFTADILREEAVKCNADLMVTGRGLAQTTISRFWSRLYSIVRYSPCPVLSI